MHQVSYPSILYFGTPVVLLSTENANGSSNLAPISSAFWLGWRCIIGISAFSKSIKIVRVHLDPSIMVEGQINRIDPDKWRPLIMSFQKFYGLGEQVHASTLSQVPEELYQTLDRQNAVTPPNT